MQLSQNLSKREEEEEEEEEEKFGVARIQTSSCLPEERGRERRKDEWVREICGSLIVNNDDICFKHILPRLNRTDVKFLYGVNTETRKLIKRSSRAGDLKKSFK